MIWIWIAVILMVMGLLSWRDISNYMYTRSCFKLMKQDRVLWENKKLGLTFLGVLYTKVAVDKKTPKNAHEGVVIDCLRVIDEALITMNLDGCVTVSVNPYWDTEGAVIYLVKFIPVFPRVFSLKYWIMAAISGSILFLVTVWWIRKYDHINNLIEFIKSVI